MKNKTYLDLKSLLRSGLKIQLALLILLFGIINLQASVTNSDMNEVINGIITGTITDGNGEPVIGANVIIQGTTSGTITDFEGKYSINANEGDVLVVSFIGMKSQTIVVGTSSTLDFVLLDDSQQLDEIVVIGYGHVKKKLTTGANLNMKGDKITELAPSSAIEALQGISPGVSITRNNGQPGAGTKVYVRGIGTVGNSDPLYVVDGVYVGNIDYLSPSDIESIDVLKDAASCAIYGSRAANGVVLVTTKKGKKGDNKPVITFDAYQGVQSVYKRPELLNAQQYMEILNEGRANDGKDNYDFENTIPSFDAIQGGWEGTNWFDKISGSAPVSSQALNIAGGSEDIVYSLGASRFSQDGIIGKDIIGSGLDRLTLRLNTEFVIAKSNDRDIVRIGQNFTYTNTKSKKIADGNIYWNDVHNSLVVNPLMPVFTEDEYTRTFDDFAQGQPNPVALMDYERKNNWGSNNTAVGNVYLEIEPMQDLVIRSSYGINSWFGNSRSWKPVYDLGTLNNRVFDRVGQNAWQGSSWTWSNSLAYNTTLGDHKFMGLIGNEMTKPKLSLSLGGYNENSKFNDSDRAYLDNVVLQDVTTMGLNGFDNAAQNAGAVLSYFGRLSYNFKEKYLLTGVLRADGSSNFHPDHRWGIFPSVSAGWVISSEDFLVDNNTIDFLKLRASWGQNGNHFVKDIFGYSSTITNTGSYFFGDDNTTQSPVGYPARVPNLNTSWETSEQTDLGFDAYFLNSQLQFTFDWYNKKTKDWLVNAPNLATDGAETSEINAGSIVNKGIELALGWNDREGPFKWGATVTYANNNNEVTEIGNEEKVIHGVNNVLSQGTAEIFRAEVGHSIGYFWGYETDGILQNQAEVDAYIAPDNSLTQENETAGLPYFDDLKPGDVRFVDQNQDGIIDDEDKIDLGSPQPKNIYGLQLNAEYKGVYINTTVTGQSGGKIMKSYRSFADRPTDNYTIDVYERWHGEGTSTKYPILSSVTHRNANYISDLYLHDADFIRISNITIGYNLKDVFNSKYFTDFKIYGTVKNLATFTGYNGLDPEVGYGPSGYPWASGIDLGLYPSARTFLAGISLSF